VSKAINWCKESEAMELLGYTKESLRILTRNEKRKRIPVRTSKINHKTILYSKTDIEQFIDQQSQ
jgi:hypothetical protein